MGFTEIVSAIENARNILLVAHIQPDCDTLGSSFALKAALDKLGKEVYICCGDEMPAAYRDLFPEGVLKGPSDSYGKIDMAVAVDCADTARLGKCLKLFKSASVTVNIDHHVTNDGFAQLNYVAEASSTGEIIYELMRHCGIQPDGQSARYLYIAMATDTGNFTYSNTTSNCLRYMSEMIGLFDLRKTADVLFRRRSLGNTQLIGRALTRLELFEDNRIASVTLLESDLKEFGANSADCENIIDFARDIETVQAAVFFRELPHGVKISFRSKGLIDVGAVAAKYGGGGHAASSGCNTSGKLDDVKKDIIKTLIGLL